MKTLVLVTTLAAALASAKNQGPSPDEIKIAIEQGRAGRTLQKRCSARGDNGMDIVAEGPIGRIMRAARDAKRKNIEFTETQVSPTMAGAWLTVTARRDPRLHKQVSEYVTPGMPGGLKYQTSLIIRSNPPRSEKPIVLDPLGPIAYDGERSFSRRIVIGGPAPANLPPLPGSDMAAAFDLAAFRAIPHKDVNIVVFMTDTGELKCRIKEDERKALK